MHKVEINELGVCLDGKPLEGVKSYSLVQKETENVANLLLELDVTILSNARNTGFSNGGKEGRAKIQ